jgi:putative spermidine/putrescine transport system substrate-binding protein
MKSRKSRTLFGERALSRRQFLKLSGAGLAGAAMLGATGCGGGSVTAGNSVVFVSFGGSLQEAQEKVWLKPFSKKTGTKVLQDSPTDPAKLEAMIENEQVIWDVVQYGYDFGFGREAQMLEPLNYSIIDRDSILEELTVDDYKVPIMFYSNVIGYNTEQLDGTPENWADFFDLEKFPGNRSLFKDPSQTLEAALLGDGVPPDALYPIDVERALAKLDTIRGKLIWWETGAQSQQQLADGEVAMSGAWNGRVQTAIEAGAPLKIQWNQQIATVDYLFVPKGAPNKERAMKLIAYCVSGENNHKLSDLIPYAPVNEKSIPKVDPEVALQLPTYKDRRSRAAVLNTPYWGKNREEVTETFNKWLLG